MTFGNWPDWQAAAEETRRAQLANDEQIGHLYGELAAYGAGWITLMGGERRTYQHELDDRLQAAISFGCNRQHTTGCNACHVMIQKAARS